MDNEASNTPAEVSDKSFYLIMLAMIVGMGLYISYDMDRRYGSDNDVAGSKVTTDSSDSSAEGSEITAEGSGFAEGSGSADGSGSAAGGSEYTAKDSGSADGSTAIVENKPTQASELLAPVIVNIEKVKSVEVKPVAEIPATETNSEAIAVEKTVQETSVTTAVVAVEKVA